MIKLNINAQKLAYIAKFASKEPSRFYLQGVYFTPSLEIVATDGHRMGVLKNAFTVEAGELKEGQLLFIQRGELSQIKKIKGFVSVIIEDSGAVTIKQENSVEYIPTYLIDGTFPPQWEKIKDDAVAGTKESGTWTTRAIAFNPAYMESFAYNSKDWTRVELGPTECAPVIIKSYRLGDDFTGVLMPIRW